jgi:hypothetical protein
VVELLGKPSMSSTAIGARYLEAQRARETQAALADRFAGEYARALEGANSQERHAAALIIAEAYDEAWSLARIELNLMVAAKVYEMFGIAGDYVQAAAHWRDVAEVERLRSTPQVIQLPDTQGNPWVADTV